MNKFLSLLSATLLLASASAWSEGNDPADLTYCLDMKSNPEIAKCAGETSAGNKGRPYSKDQVEKILSQEKPVVPANTLESPAKPAATGDTPGKDQLPQAGNSD